MAGDTVRVLTGKDRADAVNAVRQTVLAALAGITVLAGLVYTARSYALSRRGQVTERFRAAIEQLASGKLEVRLGGVYSLEHVLTESPQDHTAIVNVLAGFIRNTTHRGPSNEPLALPHERNPSHRDVAWGIELPADLQAAANVLARRPDRHEPRRVDLRSAGLAGLSLRHFEFDSPPSLSWMFLTSADLRRADLRGVDFRRSILNYADLCLAWLGKARLDGVGLFAADLRGAQMNEAILVQTDLRAADLRECEGLTAHQLSVAAIDTTTRLPDVLQDDPWVVARLEDCGSWDRQHGTTACAPPTPQPPQTHRSSAGL
ncbi:pentapeptide repeat-containing protein [Streptomyces atratus]|uniref:pentapeptide repeat-containing protein n=1 Tax=Streptomyces atratus TaxID=1893 RepID=UPI002255D60E|nr:pentapeptide repeat-containing protein [Streptomyces atratus]MCX5345962.1 pentapeptide repeat-containing protein [Streptomyces atratus]